MSTGRHNTIILDIPNSKGTNDVRLDEVDVISGLEVAQSNQWCERKVSPGLGCDKFCCLLKSAVTISAYCEVGFSMFWRHPPNLWRL